MKKYVNILDLTLPYLYGPWDLEKFRTLPLYMGVGTWKNFKFCLYIGFYRPWDLEKSLAGASS